VARREQHHGIVEMGFGIRTALTKAYELRDRVSERARARALNGDSAGARTAYQDFFGLWKDAEPEIRILKEAKTEYAKLQ
jgi:hypothetical protein